jgi:hypothetical protein
MLLTSGTTSRAEFEQRTGWAMKPEGACKGDVCIPLPEELLGETLDARKLADAMGLAVAQDQEFGLMAIGPEAIGSRALTSARAPELELPDVNGNLFRLSSLRGQKIIVYAWAPY